MASPSSSSPPPTTNPTPHLLALPAPSSHPQSSPTVSTTSSSPKLPPLFPLLPTISPPKKNQPLPWTHQETVNLIQTYQEKWYSLKRGQLKASQWEEVSLTVAARCGFDEPTKTSTQCRHKMEKLRKRYRAERIKAYSNSWQYFQLMDNMERGPFPLVAQPVSAVKMQPMQTMQAQIPNSSNFNRNDEDFDSDDNDFRHGVDVRKNKSKSINHILRGGTGMGMGTGTGAIYGNNNYDNNGIRGGDIYGNSSMYGSNSRSVPLVNQRGMMPNMGRESPMMNNKKRRGHYEDSDEEDDEDEDVDVDGEGEEDVGVGDGGKELALEIRGFAERFLRVEKMKIDMMRETERYRMEMEKRRMEMILNSQRKIVDTIGRAFRAHKKLNTGEEI